MFKFYRDTHLGWDAEELKWVDCGRRWDAIRCEYVKASDVKKKEKVVWDNTPYKLKTHLEWLYLFWLSVRINPKWIEDLKEAKWEPVDIEFMIELDKMQKAGI